MEKNLQAILCFLNMSYRYESPQKVESKAFIDYGNSGIERRQVVSGTGASNNGTPLFSSGLLQNCRYHSLNIRNIFCSDPHWLLEAIPQNQ